MSNLAFKLFRKAAYSLRGRHLNRFYIVRATLNFVLRNLKPSIVTVYGNRMFLDKDDGMRLSIVGIYEPITVRHFREIIKPGDTVLDIGAHIGYYTLMSADLVGKRGKVYAFEPNTDNLTLLNKNIKANRYKNVVLVDKAVAKSTKKARLFINPISTGMHSLIDIDNNGKSTMVETVSLDNFFGKKPPKISVIKIDIEGGEYAAFEGMIKLLKESKKLTIFTEYSPFAIKKSGRSPRGFLNYLKSCGFALYGIDEFNQKVMPIKITSFISSFPTDRDSHINLMAVKG